MYLFSNKKSEFKSPTYRDLKVSFMCLIRLHHFACAEITTKGGAHVIIILNGIDTLSCGLCGRECHLAYITCKCYPDPICIFHDIYDKCPCKGSRLMAVREEILEMQNVARRLQSEDEELLKEVEALIRIKSEAFGCCSSMTINLELDELIRIQPESQTASQPIPKKSRTQYQ